MKIIKGFLLNKIYDINLDYLRGILAIYIVIYHLLSWNHFIDLREETIFMKFAFYFVSIFFVISGYALTLSAINYRYNFKNRWNVFYYFQRRFARIYPLFLFVIILAILIGYKNVSSIKEFLYQATLTFNIFNRNGLTPASWSIGVEVIFYLFFPLIFIIFDNLFKLNKPLFNIMLFLIIFLLLLSSYYNYYEKFSEKHYFFIYVHNFYNHLYFFLIGMYFAFNRQYLFNLKNKKFFKFFLFFLLILFLIWNSHYTNLYWNYLYGINRIILSSSSLGIFLLFLLFFNFKGFIKNILKFLGDISYTVYLMHPLFLYLYASIIHRISNLLHLLLSIFFVITGSAIIYFYYEDPFRKLINSLKVR